MLAARPAPAKVYPEPWNIAWSNKKHTGTRVILRRQPKDRLRGRRRRESCAPPGLHPRATSPRPRTVAKRLNWPRVHLAHIVRTRTGSTIGGPQSRALRLGHRTTAHSRGLHSHG